MNSSFAPPNSPALIVLDTNVVLDALLFRDAHCIPLNEQLDAGGLHWVASVAMRTELANVLTRPAFNPWRAGEEALWARWAENCQPLEPRALTGAALRLQCTDRDDQMFIDLALTVSGQLRHLESRIGA